MEQKRLELTRDLELYKSQIDIYKANITRMAGMASFASALAGIESSENVSGAQIDVSKYGSILDFFLGKEGHEVTREGQQLTYKLGKETNQVKREGQVLDFFGSLFG